MIHLPVITVSQMRCHRRCNREHHLRYNLGYRPVADAAALRFGKLMHDAWEAWTLSAIQPHEEDDPLRAALVAIERVYTSTQSTIELEYERVKAEELIRGYHCRWFADATIFLEVEREFATPLINPASGFPSQTYRLGGKIDAIAEVVPGHPSRAPGIYVVERKTTSDDIGLGSDYWRQLRLDAQVSTYFEGAASIGYNVVGCIYDVIRKPSIRPSQVPIRDEDGVKIVLDSSGARVRTKDGKKWRETGDSELGYVLQTRPETPEEYRSRLREDIASNPDRYYQRGTVPRLEGELLDAGFDTWQQARLIREGELAERHPRNSDACRRWSRMCDFFDVCTNAASLDDPTRFRKAENPHEELSL